MDSTTASTRLLATLDGLKAAGFTTGPEWEAAHRLCQECEGTAVFDWLHALLHRVEGDDANAGYWYARAGRERHPGPVEAEWRQIRAAVAGA